jgi:hypothetical protein
MKNFRQPLFILILIVVFIIGMVVAFSFSATKAQSADEFSAPSVASYGIFEVEGSGVNGNLGLSENFDGGGPTKIVVTLIGITEGTTYPVAVFDGDCGPDRNLVLALRDVGADTDPYASISYSELPFESWTSGDYFVYVYDPASSKVLACGEVGQDANASASQQY